ncbi:MAG: hypothetical protein HGA81_00575 [Chlorobium limicola]|nr:hypothetical protein [Chlorobium limicola]
MKTAVQTRRQAELCAYTAHGKTDRIIRGETGDIALYENGQTVVYIVEKPFLKKAYLFTTNAGAGTHKIPGVFPEVHLLLHTKTRLKTNRLLKYLQILREENICLDHLPDGFFIRLNTHLEQRNSSRAEFHKLLLRYKP